MDSHRLTKMPAPKAYLGVPLVGAFFIDFANALLITLFLNLFG